MRLILAALLAGLPRVCAWAEARRDAQALGEGADPSAVYEGGTTGGLDAGAVPPAPEADLHPEEVPTPGPQRARASNNPPPAPGESEASSPPQQDKDAEKKSWWDKLPKKEMAIGAAFGAIGFGVIGLALGGPAGMLLSAALGAALMAGVAYVNSL